MEDKNKSLLEIAVSVIKSKKKPQTLESIQTKVFDKKGIKNPSSDEIAQFDVDFMLSGLFVFLGEDNQGNQIWDLKENQAFVPADKITSTYDPREDEEEAAKNELNDDNVFSDNDVHSTDDDDETDQVNEEEELAAEFGLVSADSDDSTEIERTVDPDEEDEFETEEEDDDILIELEKRNKI